MSLPLPSSSTPLPRSLLLLLAVLLCGVDGTGSVPLPRDGSAPERAIGAGEVQSYGVEMEAGQFLRVRVQEEGADLALRLLDPQGNPVALADSLTRGRSTAFEDLAAVAESSGTFQLQVLAGKAGTEHYVLQTEGPRVPRGDDRKRAEAVAATWRGLLEPGKADAATRARTLETALALWQDLHEPPKVAETLFDLGRTRATQGDLEAAVQSYQQAAEIWGRTVGGLLHANALTNLGNVLRRTDRREEARNAYQEALRLAREGEDYDLQAENLGYLGILESEAGEIRKSLDLQTQAADLAHKGGNRERETLLLNELAGAYDQLGEPQKALAYYQRALESALASPKKGTELIQLNNMGDMYRTLGEWDKAVEFFERAEELSRSAEKPEDRAKILINLAFAYRRHLGRSEQARTLLEEALRLGRETSSDEAQSFALMNLSSLELELGNPVPAVRHARAAVALGGTPEREMLSRYALGRSLRELPDLAGARGELEKALGLARGRSDGPIEAQCLLALARVFRDLGDPATALSHLEKAIGLIESRREGVISPELRTSFLASKQDYYELQVDTLMALHAARPTEGFAADALRMSERARARGLLEILGEAGAGLRQGASPALIAREREAREELDARDWYRRELRADGGDEARQAEAERRLREALDAYEQVQVELREGNPRYIALTEPQPLDGAGIQRQVLDGGAVLLEYALGAQRSFLWAVGPDSLRSFELPARDLVDKAARDYYESLTVRNDRHPGETLAAWKRRIAEADTRSGQAGRKLAEMILRPAEPFLGDRTLLVVADGALQYIPFAALPLPSTGKPLATRHEIVSLPSASALAVIRQETGERPRAPRALAVFADPVFQKDDGRFPRSRGKGPKGPEPARLEPLTRGEEPIDLSAFRRLVFSQKEADTIAALLPPSEVFKAAGFDASRGTVETAGLAAYRNVHFATHGVVDSRRPDLSGLVLSLYNDKRERQDGFLRLNHIYNLRLDADLVVLSACRTALGKEIRGEGLVGLTRGFMYAGAARVLASLWSVEDRATAELMGSFYRGMIRDRLSPAAALRKAQLEMAQSPHHSSPYYWAGFSLQGEWR